MSLGNMYNMVHGVNPCTFLILPMLSKHPDEYPRFRDCFMNDESREDLGEKIFVYTRVGGGNRESYREEIERLINMPTYITDYDDSFDSTYAMFVFDVPEEYKEDFDIISGRSKKEGNIMSIISEKYFNKMCEVYPKLIDKFKEARNGTTNTDDRKEVS